MNISSQFLFKLIFELSKKDAQSFTKRLKYNGFDDGVELFEKVISSYDKNSDKNITKFEKNLKEELSSKLSKHYRVKKSKLKKELLLFLKDKNLEKNHKRLIREKIESGVALAQLRYYNEGISIINEAKEEAIKEEFFDEVLYALEKERTFNLRLRRISSEALKFNKEVEHYQSLLNNLNQYTSLSFYIFSFQGDLKSDKKVITDIKQNELLKDEKAALSLAAKKFFFLSWLDIYNVEKDYEKMYELVLKAVSFAEHATSINPSYAKTLILMYARLEFTTRNSLRFKENLEAIELIENFKVPKIYEKNDFIYRVINISVKNRRITNYSDSNNPKLYPYCKEVENFMESTKMSLHDTSLLYYSLIFNYTVKLNKYKNSCVLGKKYVQHVLDNLNEINPNDNQTIQCFLCYLLSAYTNYTEDTFEYIFEYLFKKKNAKYFISPDAPFHYVFRLYNLFLKAFKQEFYSEEILSEYYDIWKEVPDFLPKANCIPKEVLDKKYDQNLVETISSKYEEVIFEC